MSMAIDHYKREIQACECGKCNRKIARANGCYFSPSICCRFCGNKWVALLSEQPLLFLTACYISIILSYYANNTCFYSPSIKWKNQANIIDASLLLIRKLLRLLNKDLSTDKIMNYKFTVIATTEFFVL